MAGGGSEQQRGVAVVVREGIDFGSCTDEQFYYVQMAGGGSVHQWGVAVRIKEVDIVPLLQPGAHMLDSPQLCRFV
jgi:hypothetical protein